MKVQATGRNPGNNQAEKKEGGVRPQALTIEELPNEYVPRPEFKLPTSELLFSDEKAFDAADFALLLASDPDALRKDMTAIIDYGVQAAGWLYDLRCMEEIETRHIDFVNDALLLLSTVDDDRSLETILGFLSGQESIVDFYAGDYLTEELWNMIYRLAPGRWTQLSSFFLDELTGCYYRLTVSTALSKMYLSHPEHRGDIRHFYLEYFEQVLTQTPDTVDRELLSSVMVEVLESKIEGLQPMLSELFQKGYTSYDIIGLDEAGYFEEWDNTPPIQLDSNSLSPEAQMLRFFEDRDAYEARRREVAARAAHVAKEWSAPTGTIIKPPKIGRNEPCPCGSGKKYKKCCW